MIYRKLSAIAVLLVGLLALAGCQSGGSGESQGTIGFNYDLPYYLQQVTAGSAAASDAGSSQRAFTADQVWTGTLMATDTGSGDVFTFDWSVYLDGTTYAVESNKTIILFPGDYDFALSLTQGSQEYAGEANGVTIIDGQNSVAMTIKPVIGDVTTGVVVVARLADFIIQYDTAELGGFTTPQLGFILDGGSEMVFAINLGDGRADIPGTYLNLPQGVHNIQLKFYDEGTQIGRSIATQETVNIVAGLNITMDLVSLQGEMVLALNEAGGDATFNLTIPAEVVNEAGGTANLDALFQVAGAENPLQETLLSLTPAGGDYAAQVIFGGMQYGDVSLVATFTEISSGELLGSCTVATVTLSVNPLAVQCDLTLRRRAVISGTLLATVGVNVFNDAGEPVFGAPVTANGAFVGLTGSGAFGTAGYLRFLRPMGTYDIASQVGYAADMQSVVLTPLSITNLDLHLVDTLAGSVLFFENFADNSQGWGLDTEWEIGSATAGPPACCGLSPDPGYDASPTTDNGVAGVVIGGAASTALHDFYYLTSPVIDASGVVGTLNLSYARWLNSDYTPFMQNVVEVFDGTTWVTVWNSGGPPPLTATSWSLFSHDITAYANPALQVRFGFNITSTGVFTAPSWNVDEVAVTETP